VEVSGALEGGGGEITCRPGLKKEKMRIDDS